jgi:hypothetical protein
MIIFQISYSTKHIVYTNIFNAIPYLINYYSKTTFLTIILKLFLAYFIQQRKC